MRTRSLTGAVVLMIFCIAGFSVYLHSHAVSSVPRRGPSVQVMDSMSPSPTPSAARATPSSTSSTSKRSAPLSWRDIEWDAYRVIDTYKQVAPREERLDPCQQNMKHCERIAQYILLHYPKYHVPTPLFAESGDRDVWLRGYEATYPGPVRETTSCADRRVDLCVQNPELTDWRRGIVFDGDIETVGRIMSFYNASVPGDSKPVWDTCGNMHNDWPKLVEGTMSNPVKEAFIFKVPGHHEFQHFLDGSFPKFVQWLDYMDADNMVLVMLEKPAGRFLCDLPQEQNLPAYCDLRPSVTSAHLLHYGCYTPTMHPYHWRRMQTVMGIRDIPVEERNLIIYATRSGNQASNTAQRLVLNDDAVRDLIVAHFKRRNQGEEVVVYYSKEYTPLENLRLWNAARAVIGPHGGALYNTFFCLPDTVLVEFLDVQHNGIPWNHLVPHKASSFLGHKYYSMPHLGAHNFHVPLDKLQAILDKEFPVLDGLRV